MPVDEEVSEPEPVVFDVDELFAAEDLFELVLESVVVGVFEVLVVSCTEDVLVVVVVCAVSCASVDVVFVA